MDNDEHELLNYAQVCRMLNRDRTTIFRWWKSGFFPKPIMKNNRVVGWRKGVVIEWLKN